jgi:hypothetical protein
VDAYDDRSRAEEWSRVLHVQKVRAVAPQPSGKIETQTDERVHSDLLLQEPFGDFVKRVFLAKIRHEIGLMIQQRETIQEISNICLVPC